MPEKRPDWMPAGYRFDPQANRLERLKSAPEGETAAPPFIYPAGHLDSAPVAVYHPQKHCNGHFDRDWQFVPHGVPEGFHWQEGRLVAQDAPELAQVTGTAEQPASLPAAAVTGESGTVTGP